MLAILALTAWSAAAAAPTLPAEIEAHYRDVNFVNAFSTLEERRLIADRRPVRENPRLARVAEAMARIQAVVEETDPGVAVLNPRPEIAQRAALLRVLSFTIDEQHGQATVQMEALALDPPAQGMLLARFEDLTREGRTPGVDEILKSLGRPPTRTLEMHAWTRTEAGWRRNPATFLFVER